MKTLYLLLSLTFLGIEQDQQIIHQIMSSNSISISIECLDLGYVKNKQIYYIDVASNQVYVTHRAMNKTEQDNTLNSTQVKPKVLTELTNYFTNLKTFELTQKIEHDSVFNSKTIHQFISLQSLSDTLMISDVKDEGFSKIHQIILNNK